MSALVGPRKLHFALGLLSAFIGFGLGGCKNKDYPACKKDRQCEKGETCVENICQNCESDTDCAGQAEDGGDFICFEHRCTDPALAGAATGGGDAIAGEEGSPCADSTQCFGGLTCLAGACSPCNADDECSNGSCNLDTGRCAAADSCETDDQCAAGEICDGGMCIFLDPGGQTGVCGLDAVFFAFDSPTLTPSTQEALTTAAECMKTQEGQVTLEAHADNRGTEEYNILLTDKRGQSVKNFLQNLGVTADKMTVMSKGALEAAGTDESTRAQDRRVEFIWN